MSSPLIITPQHATFYFALNLAASKAITKRRWNIALSDLNALPGHTRIMEKCGISPVGDARYALANLAVSLPYHTTALQRRGYATRILRALRSPVTARRFRMGVFKGLQPASRFKPEILGCAEGNLYWFGMSSAMQTVEHNPSRDVIAAALYPNLMMVHGIRLALFGEQPRIPSQFASTLKYLLARAKDRLDGFQTTDAVSEVAEYICKNDDPIVSTLATTPLVAQLAWMLHQECSRLATSLIYFSARPLQRIAGQMTQDITGPLVRTLFALRTKDDWLPKAPTRFDPKGAWSRNVRNSAYSEG